MATANRVGVTAFATPTDREFVITRVLDAPRRLVFEAWTDPEHLPHWLLGPEGWTMPVCEIDLRPGGVWRFVWRHADGNEMEMRGVYREIVPPERLVSTESWGGDWPETLNTLVFSEEDGKTTLTCTVLYPSKEARDAGAQDGDEGRRLLELRSSRRIPANPGMKRLRGRSPSPPRWRAPRGNDRDHVIVAAGSGAPGRTDRAGRVSVRRGSPTPPRRDRGSPTAALGAGLPTPPRRDRGSPTAASAGLPPPRATAGLQPPAGLCSPVRRGSPTPPPAVWVPSDFPCPRHSSSLHGNPMILSDP